MINIQHATEADLPQILSIYNDAILHTTAVYDYEPHTIEMRTEWFKEKRKHAFAVFVAEENGVILGFSTLGHFRTWEGYKFTVENAVYVKADSRGKGIGKLLLKPLIDNAKALRYHTIMAGIDATNEASIALHKQFGFEQVAYMKEVGYKFNRWLDLVFMQLMV
ncbi:GNAT family N-acetyltransferase [Panacibacter sp. KCS-6]|uniref:GNAT family N-acetyltransferase n=2 Tax=Limnovirga soli TaxID=2656915 RepID=A0A8J8JQA3_9BACT|nr:GNAT family N-acetyltransferase [Limnovirga soli]